MASHTVTLPDELNSFLTESVASGDYPDTSAVVRDALRALRREDQLKLKALIAAIDEGEASGVFEGDPFESVRQEMGWTSEI
jgi:antitoxin ParD1/3/4